MKEDKIFDIEFDCDGKHYKGWVNPSEEINDKGLPVSFHVVLDNVSFGHLSYSNGNWSSDEQRPAALVEAVGKELQQRFQTT
jgi:hypothetical protein